MTPESCRLCGASGHTRVIVFGAEKKLIRCTSCKVVFLDPFPDEDDVTAEFEERHITTDERLENFFGPRRDPVLSFVASQIRKSTTSGSILDVGCAGGHFLERFFASSTWQRFGVEPSRFAAARAREKGIHVYQGPLSLVTLPPRAFDVITVLGVFLYFRDPRHDLEILRTALKPDGVLVIELPLSEAQLWRNSAKLSRVIVGKSRSLLGSGHLFYYNVDSLTSLLRETGFNIDRVLSVPAMKQNSLYQDFVSNAYYQASRSLWTLSRSRIMLGPDFLTLASLA